MAILIMIRIPGAPIMNMSMAKAAAVIMEEKDIVMGTAAAVTIRDKTAGA